jgi:fatty acid desaturase
MKDAILMTFVVAIIFAVFPCAVIFMSFAFQGIGFPPFWNGVASMFFGGWMAQTLTRPLIEWGDDRWGNKKQKSRTQKEAT